MKNCIVPLLLFISFLAVGGLVLSGCKAAAPATAVMEKSDSTTVSSDSTWFTIENVTDTIYLPGDSIPFVAIVKCDSVTNQPKDIEAVVEGQNGRLMISLKKGILKVLSERDSLKHLIETKNKVIHHLEEKVITLSNEKQTTNTVVEYRTHWYDMAARWLACISIISCLFYLIIITRIRK